MGNARLLAFALVAAFVAFCFTREPQPPRTAPRGDRASSGDGGTDRPRRAPRTHPHVHEGDPSVRH